MNETANGNMWQSAMMDERKRTAENPNGHTGRHEPENSPWTESSMIGGGSMGRGNGMKAQSKRSNRTDSSRAFGRAYGGASDVTLRGASDVTLRGASDALPRRSCEAAGWRSSRLAFLLAFLLFMCVVGLAGCASQQDTQPQDDPAPVEADGPTTTSEAELPHEGDYLYQVMTRNSGMPDITQEAPVIIEVGIDSEGYLRVATFDDPTSVAAATDAFTQIRLGAMTDEFITDNYNYIALEFADGQRYTASLLLNRLEASDPQTGDWHSFELEGLDDLWQMANDRAVDYEG